MKNTRSPRKLPSTATVALLAVKPPRSPISPRHRPLFRQQPGVGLLLVGDDRMGPAEQPGHGPQVGVAPVGLIVPRLQRSAGRRPCGAARPRRGAGRRGRDCLSSRPTKRRPALQRPELMAYRKLPVSGLLCREIMTEMSRLRKSALRSSSSTAGSSSSNPRLSIISLDGASSCGQRPGLTVYRNVPVSGLTYRQIATKRSPLRRM